MSGKRIPLSPGFHAEPGETRHHLHDVFTTLDVGENERISVGTLSRAGVKAWRDAAVSAAATSGYLAGNPLTAIVTVRPDGSTGCSLRFGNHVGFTSGREAVEKAIAALQAELSESERCPASGSAR